MSNSTTEVLCPLENRRLISSIQVNLGLSYCVTLIALYHLARIRREPFPGFLIFTLIVSPISLVLRYIGTVLYILLNAFKRRYVGEGYKGDAGHFIMQHMNVLLFAHVYLGENRHRAIISTGPKKTDYYASSFQRQWQVLLSVIWIFKCTATIVLYIQRWRNSATTLADDKLLELAFAGLLIAGLTLLFLLKRPRRWAESSAPTLPKEFIYHSYVDAISPRNTKSTWTSVDVVLATGRDVWIATGYVSRDVNPWLVWQVYFSGIIGYVGYLFVKLASGTWCVLLFGMPRDHGDCPPFDKFISSWIWIASFIGIPMGLWMVWLMVLPQYRPNYLTYALWTFLFALLMPIWLPLTAGFVFSPLYLFIDYTQILGQFSSLEKWPLDQLCPMLWSNSIDRILEWLI